jgi:hypothetical protein
MLDSSRSGVVQPRTLVTDKLNIVGENHTESSDRRILEREFAAATTLSANYWTEAEFLDLPQVVGSRKAHGGPAQSTGADLMEFRAVHGAALLIGSYEVLAKKAGDVVTNPTEVAFNEFVTARIPEFLAFRDKLNARWRPTATDAVNQAVQTVYTNVDRVCQTYLKAIAGAPPEKRLSSTKILAGNTTVLRVFVPPLAKAVGSAMPPDNDAAVLAKAMGEERSKYMGLAAGLSKETGVWKVGDLHIADLCNGSVKIDTSRINVMTRADFNAELKTWRVRVGK